MYNFNDIGWKLSDDRIWDVDKASFAPRDGLTITPSPVDEKGEHSLEGLIQALDFYGLPKGELASQEEVLATFTASIQSYLDDFARTRLYDSIASAASYATSKNPVFQAEGQYAVDARDEVWAKAYEIQAEVLSGSRAIPTAEELMELLPKLEWPTERPQGMAGM